MTDPSKQIKGCRDLSQEEIDLINKIKDMSKHVKTLCDYLDFNPVDPRWAAIGRTHLQQGFMALVRSVDKPESF